MKISFVIPCYRSEKMIGKVIEEIRETMAKMPQYTNEASVRNQTSRCNKKFKETFMKLRNLL